MSNLISKGLGKKQSLLSKGLGGISVTTLLHGGASPASLEAYYDYVTKKEIIFTFKLSGLKILPKINKKKILGKKVLKTKANKEVLGLKVLILETPHEVIGNKLLLKNTRYTTKGIKILPIEESIAIKGKKDLTKLLLVLDIL